MHTRARILYVDDDQDIRLMMLLLLEQSGYGVMTASTAADALELASTIPFDLYILDMLLPDSTGIELCQKLRETYSDALVVYYTGYANDPRYKDVLVSCGDSVLQKPVALADLQETIAMTLLRKQSKRKMSHTVMHR